MAAPLKERYVESVEERRDDPRYQHYVKHLFPQWMSMTPGGLNYPENAHPDDYFEFIKRWEACTKELLATAVELDISIYGLPLIDAPDRLTPERTVEIYSYSDILRTTRNRWKQIMRYFGWEFGDKIWRNPNRDLSIVNVEWTRFREANLNKVF